MSAPPWQQRSAAENTNSTEASSSKALLVSEPPVSLETSSKWSEYKAPDGRIYWNDGKTSVWEKPDELKTEEEASNDCCIEIGKLNWKEYIAPGGRKYWYNTKSGESVWNMPDACKKAIEALRAAKEEAALRKEKNAMGIDASNQDDGLQMVLRDDMVVAGPDGKAQSLALASSWVEEKEVQNYTSLEDAEAAFMKMLRRCGVGPNWTWEQTMRTVIKQPQYRAIKDPIQRKLTFEKYVEEIQKQESEREQDRLIKLKTDFNRMFKMHPEIKYYTRWRVAREILEGETAFRATDNEEERKQLFQEYIMELKRIENEKEHKMRNEAMDAFSALLESLKLKPYSRWSSAQAKFREHPEFKSNPKFQILSNLDILIVYESHIKGLERAYIDQRQANKLKKQRTERKNREEFTKLLQDLYYEKKIGPGTKWMTIYPLIKNDVRYKNILGQPGSTPLELFWDIVEEAERDMRHKKNLAHDILTEQKFDFNEKTTLSQFSEAIHKDKKGAELSDSTLSSIYVILRDKVLRRLEDEKKSDERRQKRRINELRYVIKHLKPPLQLSDTWEDVRKRIEHTEEFLAIDSEENRELAFKKQMRRMKEKHEEKDASSRNYHKSSRVSRHSRDSPRSRDADSREFSNNLRHTRHDYHVYRDSGYRNYDRDSGNESDTRYRKRIKSDKDYNNSNEQPYDKEDKNVIESSEEEGEIH
ncbi:hypothetical protein PORY_000339 [Pneumocystis oryctolagi]|uniref:Uncharacterized protein n=1 Tax=Pneumocystis oryctolagi TaxID=42067 RepID=A0ACB7CF94_9ASCO|nr:hypothetical protein PORY_000339 [Pneumocystis oryctolagi]